MPEPRKLTAQEIQEALAGGAVLVTASQRLAAGLQRQYDQWQLRRGLQVWETPELLPWAAWLQQCREARETRLRGPAALLLSETQELLLWEQVIRSSPASHALLQVPSTARRAREAAERMLAWRIREPDLERAGLNPDSESFLGWWRQVRAELARRRWLLAAQLPDTLFTDNDAPCPQRLLLAGFDELSPQQQALFARMQEAGCQVDWLRFAPLEGRALRHACLDAGEEAMQAARWARSRLERAPAARIAIVVPDLASRRDDLARALDQMLAPAALRPGDWEQPRPYNFSLGRPLIDYPLIRIALDGLGLMNRELPLEAVSRLLRSPFLAGWEEEAGARARLDARLRDTGELQVDLRTLLYQAGREDRDSHCPGLAQTLARLRERLPERRARMRPGAWVERCTEWLELLGWGRGRSLSSDEYQTLEAWRGLLAGLGGLELLLDEIDLESLLRHVQRQAAARVFQPQRPELPVQVLGILETSGQQFDYLWVTGLHDGAWPAPPRPNPFLPLSLQRECGLPHASAERELEVARRITERLLQSAPEVIVSVPQREGDRELRPSPLLEALPPAGDEELDLWPEPLWRDRLFAAADCEVLVDDPAPPLQGAPARGGSAVFKHQAACPFRAFAELRLGARPLEQAEIGLDSRTRGSLLHRILEGVWRELGDQAGLLGMAEEALAQLVQDRVREELDREEVHHPRTLTARFRDVEAQRLQRLILDWLDLERERAPFVSVETEKECRLVLGGVEVQVKIDRIDTLGDGRKLLIDYKTGRVEPRQWFGERPEEPQLPLYSAAVEGPVAGLLFGQLQAGDLRFNGVLEEQGLVPRATEYTRLKYTKEQDSWQAVLEEWRATLEGLGEAFRAGRAEVDPKKIPDTCQYCALTPLCRIREQERPGDEDGEGGDD